MAEPCFGEEDYSMLRGFATHRGDSHLDVDDYLSHPRFAHLHHAVGGAVDFYKRNFAAAIHKFRVAEIATGVGWNLRNLVTHFESFHKDVWLSMDLVDPDPIVKTAAAEYKKNHPLMSFTPNQIRVEEYRPNLGMHLVVTHGGFQYSGVELANIASRLLYSGGYFAASQIIPNPKSKAADVWHELWPDSPLTLKEIKDAFTGAGFTDIKVFQEPWEPFELPTGYFGGMVNGQKYRWVGVSGRKPELSKK